MSDETNWTARALDLLQKRGGDCKVAALDLRAEATTDEWLRGYLVKLGAEELMRQAQAKGS